MRMGAVRPHHAVFMMLACISFACGQDHQLLTENCNWAPTNWVRVTRGSKVILSNPSVDLVSNLVCRTRFYVNDFAYTLKMRVRLFDLKGSNDCGRYSEMITLQISETDASKNISWCGGMYAEELILPVRAVNLIYNTGAFGEGAGFQLEFSAVPQISCYDEWKQDVTVQPKLLYSPNFPGHYKSQLSCDVQLYAMAGQYIHIQSLLVQIEDNPSCLYDALVINDVRYCGQDPIDVIIPASSVDIKFITDQSNEMDGFILKYEAVPTKILNCTAASNFIVKANNKTSLVVMETSGRKFNVSPWCQVVLDSGSDDAVLDVWILSNLSDVDGFTLLVDGEADLSQSGKLTVDLPGQRPYRASGVNTLNYLRTPSRRVVFNVMLRTGNFIFRVQAVNKEILPQRVLARYSLVWVSAELARSVESSKMFVMPARSGESVEVGVFYTDQYYASLDRDADRLPVASYAMVYNGEDTSYFELTKGCSTNTSNPARSIYSIRSQNVTVEIKRNPTSDGFWMYFAPSDGSYLPQPEELFDFKTFSTTFQVNVKNLFCKWTTSASRQLDMVSKGQPIRLRADNNFDPASLDQYFIVKEELNTVMKYTKITPSNLWLYSSDPISITVSVFNNAADLRSLYFEFQYEMMSPGTNLQPLYCQRQILQANETVQSAMTPNYPAFFLNEPCEWTIVQNTQSGRRDNIFVDFPDLSNFPCSEGHEFQIITSNSDGSDTITWPKVCNVSSFHQSYISDQVKILFHSRYQYLLPGFKFTYYTKVSHTREVILLATKEFQFLSSPNYPTSYPSLIDYRWHITTGSDSSVVDLDLLDFLLEDETQMQCLHDYVEIYDGSTTPAINLIKTMCGSVYYGHYSSTASDLIVVFHSDEENNYQGFRFQFRSREKDLNAPVGGRNVTGIIMGAVSGGIVFILLVVGVIIVYLLRRRKRQRTNTHIRVPVPATGSQGPMSRSDDSVFIVYGMAVNPGYAPPSYWETHSSQVNNDPPSYSSVHDSRGLVLPEYVPGYTYEHPGINLLERPPPYSSELPDLQLDASRLESSTSLEHASTEAQPDPTLAALRDADDSLLYDRIDYSAQGSCPAGADPLTASAPPAAADNLSNNPISDPPPPYESGSYVQITGGHRHDPRRVPHIKNDRLGYL